MDPGGPDSASTRQGHAAAPAPALTTASERRLEALGPTRLQGAKPRATGRGGGGGPDGEGHVGQERRQPQRGRWSHQCPSGT